MNDVSRVLERDSWKSLFHVTHEALVPSIRKRGLIPTARNGVRPRVWLAPLERLPWAIGHVAAHHGWDESSLIVLRVAVPSWTLYAVPHGVFCTNKVIPPSQIGSGAVACQY